MQLSVTFRHMEASDAIKEYAREKVDRIKKYFPDPISAHVVFSTERGYQHVADVNIQLHNGLAIKGREITEDMYSSIDLVMAKIERQVRRYKEKIRGHKAREDLSSIPVAHHVLSGEEPGGEDETQAAAAAAGTSAQQPVGPKIIRSEKFHAQPMAVDEAVMQLNLAGELFLVFRNRTTGLVNVLYRRDDGTYGLIDTGPAVATSAPH